MKFVKDPVEWDILTKSRDGLVGQYIQRTATRLLILAKNQVGIKTGKLRASIRSSTVGGPTGIEATIGSDQRIAYLHHEGTRAHIITPKRQQTLRFYSRGRIVYTKLVHHPGTKPNRYLTDNLSKVIDD